jgi:hypothetical protein
VASRVAQCGATRVRIFSQIEGLFLDANQTPWRIGLR